MKPLISYYGGKQRLASKIVEYFPPHTVYVEPFCGGASCLFAKSIPTVRTPELYREVINDHDEKLITLYRMVQEKPEELAHLIRWTPFSQAEHKRACEILKGQADELETAWAYFVGIHQAFGKQLDGGWAISICTNNQAAVWEKRKARLPQVFERLRGVHLSSEDALKCIERWDSPQTLFYCDPPYPGTDQGHYSGYKLEDLQRLVDLLDTVQGSFVLSNYPQPNLRVPGGWEVVEFEAQMSVAKGKGSKRTEVIWIKDNSSRINREELQISVSQSQKNIFEEVAI